MQVLPSHLHINASHVYHVQLSATCMQHACTISYTCHLRALRACMLHAQSCTCYRHPRILGIWLKASLWMSWPIITIDLNSYFLPSPDCSPLSSLADNNPFQNFAKTTTYRTTPVREQPFSPLSLLLSKRTSSPKPSPICPSIVTIA